MNAKLSTNRKFKRILTNILSICAVLTIALPVTQVAYAVSSSPFVGHWQATDVDGSDIRLAISGPSRGPLQITWTESYISFCAREAGIVRGTGQPNTSDPNLLEADLHLECFKTGASLDLHLAWRYHPLTGTLSSRYGNGTVTIWHRPGQPPPTPPALGLRVNYGDNWVESFYEGGHMAWVTVTDNDGITVKATAELVTEPKGYWGGETGFQSLDSAWLDANGNPMENPPDIQPNDWVFGWVDNGASAQVQIGEISGTIDLAADSIAGTITAPWLTDRVQVECLDWGSGGEPYSNKDGGSILTNGVDPYSCSWVGEWDIQPGQTIGVGYFGPDGNWVANAFSTPKLRLIAFPAVEQIFGYNWLEGSDVYLTINNPPDFTQTATVGPSSWDPNDIMAFFDFAGLYDLKPGDVITLSGSGLELTYTVLNLSVTNVDAAADTVAGTADPGASLTVAPFGFTDQTLQVTADQDGNWLASFADAGIDLVEGMCGRSEMYNLVTDNSTAVDWCVFPPPPTPMTFIVTNIEDVIANDGVCTLREAVIAANMNMPSGDMNGECPAGLDNETDTILLTANQTYSLTIGRTNDTEADGDLDIQDNSSTLDLIIKVDGDGKASISQDASSVDDRVLENHEATIQLENLTITGGSNVGGGGGLLNNGTMDMIGSEVSGNSVGWDGGGIWNGPSATLNMDSCTITGNFSDVFGGGIMNKGTLTVNNSEIRANSTPVKGGGITNEGTLIVDHSILSGNSAGGQGGVLYNSGTATITNGTMVGGTEAEDANVADGGGGLFSSGTLTVDGSIVTGNRASYGGGLFNWIGGMLTISNSTISNNKANEGGGLHNKENSTTVINNSIFSDNYAEWSAGGIDNWGTITITGSALRENMSPGEGDAIANSGPEGSTASVTASCIVGNGATAVLNVWPATQNFTGNWWGDATGPSGAGTGSGDSVSNYIDFSNWLAEPPSICSSN